MRERERENRDGYREMMKMGDGVREREWEWGEEKNENVLSFWRGLKS